MRFEFSLMKGAAGASIPQLVHPPPPHPLSATPLFHLPPSGSVRWLGCRRCHPSALHRTQQPQNRRCYCCPQSRHRLRGERVIRCVERVRSIGGRRPWCSRQYGGPPRFYPHGRPSRRGMPWAAGARGQRMLPPRTLLTRLPPLARRPGASAGPSAAASPNAAEAAGAATATSHAAAWVIRLAASSGVAAAARTTSVAAAIGSAHPYIIPPVWLKDKFFGWRCGGTCWGPRGLEPVG
jgi:hypothetical protein